jgi:hypothetical protein
MKKFAIISIVLLMCAACWATTKYCSPTGAGTHAGTVGNEYTLPEAKTGTSNCDTIYMAAGTYTLAANLDITTSTTWIPQGNVVISGNNYQYLFSLSNNDPTTGSGGIFFGDPTYTYSITITKSYGTGLSVSAVARSAKAILYKVYATDNLVNGITGYDGLNAAYNVTVICNQCDSYLNVNDGFSLIGDATAPTNGRGILVLNNCNGYSNGDAANDQGFTAHAIWHVVYVNGGSYHDNYGAGATMTSGALAVCDGVTFYGNGAYGGGCDSQINTSDGAAPGTSFIANKCKFYGILGANGCMNLSGTGIHRFTDCEMVGNATAEYLVSSGASTNLTFIRGIFRDLTTAGKWALSMSSSNVTGFLTLRNCTFNNNTRILTTTLKNVEITNCIFSNNGPVGIALYSSYSYPYLYGLCGHNDFYNNGNDLYVSGAGYSTAKQSTDLAVNPQYTDVTTLTLLDSSPLIGAGLAFNGGDKQFIGAVPPNAHTIIDRNKIHVGKWFKSN